MAITTRHDVDMASSPVATTLKMVPAAAARLAKRFGVYPRYWSQRRRCRAAYEQHGDQYRQNILFIAGLPKSGTTWLERMVSSFPGVHQALIPDVAAFELETGGSHDYDLPVDTFERFENMLVLTKMHVHGSPHNVRLLHEAGVKYVVLYRDLRDVAVSYYHYVRDTPWHPEYAVYHRLTLHEGLALFAIRTLPAYADWVRLWRQHRDPSMSLEIRYEDMRRDPHRTLRAVADLYDMNATDADIDRIVQDHDLTRSKLSANQGLVKHTARKGLIGGWRKQFTPALVELYQQQAGEFLMEVGYEDNLDW